MKKSMNIKRIWELMSKDDWGPEPLVIEVDEDTGEVEVCTISSHSEVLQDGLYVRGVGKTLEEALKNFELELDHRFLDID